jgi:hypothetical protein
MDARRILTSSRRPARSAQFMLGLTVETLSRPVNAGSRRNAKDALAAVRAEHAVPHTHTA